MSPLRVRVRRYRWLKHLYEEGGRLEYLRKPREALPPHVYAISAAAYRGVAARSVGGAAAGVDQSILVSGESGAGKTETVKIMMGHLASVAGGGAENEVVKRVLESQPLLESFGNAKTVRNDNSSRFGKFTQLEFDATARLGSGADGPSLVGSRCRTYLLEKSRVIQQAPGERTRVRRADISPTHRGDAAAATWIFRGNNGDAAAPTWVCRRDRLAA